jgi:hypothetical protein
LVCSKTSTGGDALTKKNSTGGDALTKKSSTGGDALKENQHRWRCSKRKTAPVEMLF